MAQESGAIGKAVGWMIRRTVRARFRQVLWNQPESVPEAPVIFAANHHGWHDGYLMYHVVKALNRPSLDWIAAYDSFPLFRTIGGLPFPPNDPAARIATLRKTVKLMKAERKSLVIFPEAELHAGPEVRPFGEGLEWVVKKVPEAQVLPISILYEMGIHERPQAIVHVGPPLESGPELAERTRQNVIEQLDKMKSDRDRSGYAPLVAGTLDVNERWDERRKGPSGAIPDRRETNDRS